MIFARTWRESDPADNIAEGSEALIAIGGAGSGLAPLESEWKTWKAHFDWIVG